MPISPKICIKYSADASSIIIEEDTGVYDVSDNTGGLGTPNNDRSDLAAVLVVSYQSYDGPEQVLFTEVDRNQSYLNTQSTEFTVEYEKDGWYKFIFAYVPSLSSGIVTPASGAFVYNDSTSRVEKYNNSLQLEPVSDFTTLNSPSFLAVKFVEEIPTIKTKTLFNDKVRERQVCKNTQGCNCDVLDADVMYLREGLFLVKNNFTTSKFEAQKELEVIMRKYKIS